MIKHVVMWKFKENTEKEMDEFLKGLKSLEKSNRTNKKHAGWKKYR